MKISDETIELNKDTLSHLSTLDKDKVYVFTVDFGDAVKDYAYKFLTNLKKSISELGVKAVYIPRFDDVPRITIDELSKYEEELNREETKYE